MFQYIENTLYCENVPLADIAKSAGTPAYVYSGRTILDNYHAYDEAFGGLDHTVCYAVKANSSLGILSLLAKAGSGFDIVSSGELYRVLQAGGDPKKVVFSGVGKTATEVEYALCQGIHSFNCESEAELSLIDALAGRAGRKAEFAVRVNPDVNAATHPYIATGLRDHKFGVDIGDVEAIYDRARSLDNLLASGVSCHIGSQLLDTGPVMEAVDKILALIERLREAGHAIRYVDLGGGLGVAYKSVDAAPEIRAFIGKLKNKVQGRGLAVMVEPGRSVVGAAGVLLTRLLYRKRTPKKEFLIVDAAMNDLIRPALYQGHHEIVPLRKNGRPTIVADVVGPICESGDFLARDREVADAAPGDLFAVSTAGAYGFVLASNYNSRPKPPEILVSGDQWRTIRARETFEDLIRGEQRF
jgi:diaminopimelate decarboxylase